VPSIGSVVVKYNALISLPGQQLVDVGKVPQLSVLNDFGMVHPEIFECLRLTELC
jgi:hypothetical protein